MLPTTVVLCIPMGSLVMIGGPPTISMSAMAMKIGMAALGKLAKKFKKRAKKLKEEMHAPGPPHRPGHRRQLRRPSTTPRRRACFAGSATTTAVARSSRRRSVEDSAIRN